MTRVALLGGFSILLALLWPSELFPVMLAGFLFINALMSAFAAAIQRQPVWSTPSPAGTKRRRSTFSAFSPACSSIRR